MFGSDAATDPEPFFTGFLFKKKKKKYVKNKKSLQSKRLRKLFFHPNFELQLYECNFFGKFEI